jgi:hypothetical protein
MLLVGDCHLLRWLSSWPTWQPGTGQRTSSSPADDDSSFFLPPFYPESDLVKKGSWGTSTHLLPDALAYPIPSLTWTTDPSLLSKGSAGVWPWETELATAPLPHLADIFFRLWLHSDCQWDLVPFFILFVHFSEFQGEIRMNTSSISRRPNVHSQGHL